jgi:hypothetical protein
MVDWEALQSSFKGFSKVKLLSYCKLIHGILNTNEQNHKFYGSSHHCPHCGTGPESFLHVVTCSSPEVTSFRSQQQEALWKSLKTLRTPQVILEYIQRGISHCDPSFPYDIILEFQSDDSSTHTSISYIDFTIAAFNEQSTHLGWDQFLRGRISKR